MTDRKANVRTAWGLIAIVLVLTVLPLVINVIRGGVGGVGVDPRLQGTQMIFAVTYPPEIAPGPLKGRFHLVVSRTAEPEPRLQLATGGTGKAYVFRREVVGWRAGHPFELTDQDRGTSLPSIAYLPAGYYWVQGVFEAEEGAPLAREGPTNEWTTHPGNLVSRPVELFIDPRSADVLRVHLARRIVETPAAP
jgi:hypothetical protein